MLSKNIVDTSNLGIDFQQKVANNLGSIFFHIQVFNTLCHHRDFSVSSFLDTCWEINFKKI